MVLLAPAHFLYRLFLCSWVCSLRHSREGGNLIFLRKLLQINPKYFQNQQQYIIDKLTKYLGNNEKNKDKLYVHAEIPGINKNDVKVNVTGDVLTISGEKKTEQKDENKNYYRIERTQGAFSRSFTLPAEIIVDKIAAEFKDGVLNITL